MSVGGPGDAPRRAPRTLGDLAARVGGRVVGDPDVPISGIATLERAGPEHLSFLTNPRYRDSAVRTRAAAVLVAEDVDLGSKPTLTVARPYVALAELLAWFHPDVPLRPGVSCDARVADDARIGDDVEVAPFAVIDRRAEIGDRARIGSGCYVGAGARIGVETVLHAGVSVYAGSVIGDRCILHSGVVIGGDGFGFADDGVRHRKIPQVARAILGDDVEVGANSTIDRGALEDTVIGSGSKIDDLVMVAHGVRIGEHCLLTAQTGVAGSTTLGDRVTLAGQSGIAGHRRIGDGVVVAAKSAVFSDFGDGAFVAGIPAVDHRRWKRAQAIQQHLPELRSQVRRLHERLATIEAELGAGRGGGRTTCDD